MCSKNNTPLKNIFIYFFALEYTNFFILTFLFCSFFSDFAKIISRLKLNPNSLYQRILRRRKLNVWLKKTLDSWDKSYANFWFRECLYTPLSVCRLWHRKLYFWNEKSTFNWLIHGNCSREILDIHILWQLFLQTNKNFAAF